MVCLGPDGGLVESPDETRGRLEYVEERVTHSYVVDSAEEGHWEVVAEYPNGGRDVAWVVDSPEKGHWDTRYESGEPVAHFDGPVAEDWPREQVVRDVWPHLAYAPYTEEEQAEADAARAEEARLAEVGELVSRLSATDYVVVKMAEAAATGTELPEADRERYLGVIEERRAWRARIGELGGR